MKKIILLSVLLFSTIAFSQTWKYNSGGNVFDGKYRTAHVIGKCSDFPYNKPGLFLNIFEEKDMNLYIANSGYYSSEYDVEILFVFNNEPNTIYYSDEISLSKDNETIFLLSFKSDTSNYISRMDFINKLKKSLKLDVRIKSSYKNRDLNFSMSGSTNAINFVLTKNYLNYESKIQEELKSIAKERAIRLDSIDKEEKIKKIKKEESIKKIESILSGLGIENNEIQRTISLLKSKSFQFNFNLSEIQKIDSSVHDNLELVRFYLYDTNNELVHQLNIYIPNYYKKLLNITNESLFEDSKKNLFKIIERFNFSLETNQSVLDKYEKSYKEKEFDIINIDSVNIIKPQDEGMVLMRLYNKKKWIVTLDDIDVGDKFKNKMETYKTY